MIPAIDLVTINPTGQVARRIITKLIGNEMAAEVSIQLNQMARATKAMFSKLQAVQVQAERRLGVLMQVGQMLDMGEDFQFDDKGVPQIRRDLKKIKKADLEQELKGAWAHIEMLYAKLAEANQIIEIEILTTGSEN